MASSVATMSRRQATSLAHALIRRVDAAIHSMQTGGVDRGPSSASRLISSAHRFLNGYTTYLNCPAVGEQKGLS